MPRPQREKGLLERAKKLPPVIGAREFCALFSVHKWTLRRRVSIGWIDLPAPLPRVPNGTLRWLREDICRWLEHPELRAEPPRGPRPVVTTRERAS
mgnify:FL=1